MKFFNHSGKHSGRKRASAAGAGKKPQAKKKTQTPRPESAHGQEDFNRRMAESLGYAPPKVPVKKSAKRKKWMIACVVAGCLALLAILAIAGFMIWSEPPQVEDAGLKVQDTLTPVEGSAAQGNSAEASAEPSPIPTPTPDPSVLRRRDDTYTILVVGRDRVGMNTDTIMLVMLDGERDELNVVSIPRDTLVNVSWSVKKVNSLYGALGTEGLVSGIEDLIGYEIDNYVIINTFVFQELIDAIGGVHFDVPLNMYYDDPGQDLHIHLNAGYQWLSGAQAEQVVRFRQNNDGTGYPNGDLGRIETQQKFGMALARQLLSLGNIKNLPQLVNIVTSNTDTDLSSGNIAFYAEEFLKLSSDSIHFYTLPCDNVSIRGGSYVSIRLYDWLDLLNSSFNPYNQDVTQGNLNILMYANGSTWSTTGYAQAIESFYDYEALLATPEPTAVPEQPVPPAEEPQPPAQEPEPAIPDPAPPTEEPAAPPLEPAPTAEPAPPPMEPAPSGEEIPPEG